MVVEISWLLFQNTATAGFQITTFKCKVGNRSGFERGRNKTASSFFNYSQFKTRNQKKLASEKENTKQNETRKKN